MIDRVDILLDDLDRIATADTAEVADWLQSLAWLRGVGPEEMLRLLHGLLDRPAEELAAADRLLQIMFQQLMYCRPEAEPGSPLLDEAVPAAIAAVYRHLPAGTTAREYLPGLLTTTRKPRALIELADLVVEDPPRNPTLAAAAFGPLFQHDDYDPRLLFPRLLIALGHLTVAAIVLDLANFLTRRARLPRHPAAEQAVVLAAFLGNLAGRLGRLETAPPQGSEEIQQRGYQINEGVTLAVSLCHALALIGDRSVVGKLYQAADLSHRRLRLEAAAALAQLGEEAGRTQLVQLAAEPSVRLRVLSYADELGILGQVDEQYQTPAARAEAELVLWLAQPAQVGLPPTRCELIESRLLYWPGYDEPVESFLFRFAYDIGDLQFSNIGLAGPVTHAFGSDLSDLPPDDIFAAFAGWSADHEEMYEFEVGEMHVAEDAEVARLQRRLHDEDYQRIEPLKLCLFFGDRVLVANATREGRPGVAVADLVQTHWLPRSASSRPPGAEEAYCIYKGRRLLRTFNEGGAGEE